MSKRKLLHLAFAFAVLLPVTAANAQRPRDDWRPENRTEWEQLGTAEIGTRLERDVIEVGRREGRFRSIGFTVKGNDVRIESLKIIYAGGEADELSVREVFKDGARSRPIDLPGRAQFIERIEVTYRSPGPVKIDFYGEKRTESWRQLGCQEMSFMDRGDVIRVGRQEGAFRAIKLQVSNAPLRLKRMRVTFGDGTSQTLDVRSVIWPGSETPPIDLDGRRRRIDAIELEYIPSISLRRPAQVCALALEGGGWGRDDRGEWHGRDDAPGRDDRRDGPRGDWRDRR